MCGHREEEGEVKKLSKNKDVIYGRSLGFNILKLYFYLLFSTSQSNYMPDVSPLP